MISKFDSIRPYRDEDIADVLKKVRKNHALIAGLVAFKFSAWPKFIRPMLRFLTSLRLAKTLNTVKGVRDFQRLLDPYIQHMISDTTESFNLSGFDKLDLSAPCVFISNHRDIALDPALLAWALHINGHDTVRIAVGDNLLKEQWIADILRLNKCFIVKRSAPTRREKLADAKLLSEYIYASLNQDKQHIWIAQREGRAKDGNDISNPAIISMLTMHKGADESFAAYIQKLRIVPVSISYEFDPCDIHKAIELSHKNKIGAYEKHESEDLNSIKAGITGPKGKVHLHFGEIIQSELTSARDVADYLDRQIQGNYKIYPTNIAAARLLNLSAEDHSVIEWDEQQLSVAQQYLQQRISGLEEDIAVQLLSMYAAPLVNKLAFQH